MEWISGKRILSVLVIVAFSWQAQAQCVVGNCENGYSVFKLDNGDMYTGQWVNGTREGYGRYDWASGAFYVGDFKYNGFHGLGTYYAPDGSVASGVFEDNVFQGADTNLVLPTPIAAPDILIWDEWIQADLTAKSAAAKGTKPVEFGAMVMRAINEFPTDFANIKTVARPKILARETGWYSNLVTKESVEAGVGATSASRKALYYNILYTGSDSLAAIKKYNNYVDVVKGLTIPCCSLIADTYDFSGPNYSSKTTSWLTLSVNGGFEESVYSDMVMELSLNTMLGANGWQITYKIYHLSEMQNE